MVPLDVGVPVSPAASVTSWHYRCAKINLANVASVYSVLGCGY